MTTASISAAGTRAHRSSPLGCAIEQGGREVVAVLDAALAGMAWGHAIAAIVEDAAGQQSLGRSSWRPV